MACMPCPKKCVRSLVAGKDCLVALAYDDAGWHEPADWEPEEGIGGVWEWGHPGPQSVVDDVPPQAPLTLKHDNNEAWPTCVLVGGALPVPSPTYLLKSRSFGDGIHQHSSRVLGGLSWCSCLCSRLVELVYTTIKRCAEHRGKACALEHHSAWQMTEETKGSSSLGWSLAVKPLQASACAARILTHRMKFDWTTEP